MDGGGGESPEARFERMVGEFGPSLDRLATAYESDPAERDDLLQEIAFALWRALPSFRGECSERTFIYRIAHNRGLTHRARRRLRVTEPLETVEVVADPGTDPEQVTIRNLTRERLQAAVRRLPEGARQVVILSLSGLGAAEIGEVLGITENNAAVRLSRARRALKDLL